MASIPSSLETITLERWLVVETIQRTRHLVGYCVQTHRGIVSSPVLSFDRHTCTGISSGGFRYVLSGDPATDGMDELVRPFSVFDPSVLMAWNVSDEYLPLEMLTSHGDSGASHHD